MKSLLTRALLMLCVALGATACQSVDDSRIPYAEVRLTFHTVGDWNIHGLKGDAASWQSYIFTSKTKIPADFPYTSLDRTGFGGILLVADVVGELLAYDLACPYEARPEVRVSVDGETLMARCPSCGSTFDIFTNYGNPRSGPCHDKGYKLKRYSVISGGSTAYRVVTR